MSDAHQLLAMAVSPICSFLETGIIGRPPQLQSQGGASSRIDVLSNGDFRQGRTKEHKERTTGVGREIAVAKFLQPGPKVCRELRSEWSRNE